MKFYTPIVLIFIFLTAGCSGQMQLLRNDKGDVQKCEVTAAQEMTTGKLLANMQQNRCVKTWEQAGYTKIK